MLDVQTQFNPRQQGVSLIEMMVGITIGLLVVLAAVGTLVLTRTSGTTVADSSQLISQGNNLMRLISFHLRQSGAIELTPIDPLIAPGDRHYMFSDLFTGNNAAGFVVQGVEGGSSAPDSMTISYENRGDTVSRDCLGATTAAGLARIQNHFEFADTPPRLTCLGSGSATAQPVAENVEDFQVWYWVAPTGATRIRRQADQVVAAGGWINVVAVEVCLQMRGEMRHPVISGSKYINCRGTATDNDGFQHQILRSTFQLRNQGQ